MSREAQTLCLGAVAEAAILVDQLARRGQAPTESVEALLGSLFRFEWGDVHEVFGATRNLRHGLSMLETVLGQLSDGGNSQALRYALAMLHLGWRLSRDSTRLRSIRSKLGQLQPPQPDATADWDTLTTGIAAIYSEHISTYSFRIQVSGEQGMLQNPRIAERIRSLLLCGLRATVLWRHVGGSRLDVLFARPALLLACRKLAASA